MIFVDPKETIDPKISLRFRRRKQQELRLPPSSLRTVWAYTNVKGQTYMFSRFRTQHNQLCEVTLAYYKPYVGWLYCN